MWNEYHENILRQWGEASACYRYMHHRSFLMYKKLSLRFNLPVIVLSTITGTANFAQTTLPASIQPAAPSIIGGLNLVAGLIATIMQFLKVNELMENHRTSALGHGSLSRNIRLQLALPREERKKEGLKFVEECKATYDSLLEQCPAIPKKILLNFEKEYPIDGVFTKPEILNVRPIPPLKLPKTVEPIRAITKTSTHLSSAQLGITLTTLLTGFVAEPALTRLLTPWLSQLGFSEDSFRTISVVLAMTIATVFSFLIGELVPKNAALSAPKKVLKMVVGFQLAFTWVFHYLVQFMNNNGNWLVRKFGVEPKEELSSARTADELASLVRRSATLGSGP